MMSSALWILTLSLNLLISPLAYANSEVDALIALKQSLSDPNNKLSNWDPASTDPCTFYFITCNDQNSVIRVDLQYKNIAGNIAHELGNLAQLQHLELYKNKIEGSIPAELGKLTNLISLDLYENNISGTLPSSLGNLNSLQVLRLNDNKLLSGQVPKALLRIPPPLLDISNTQLTLAPPSRPLI